MAAALLVSCGALLTALQDPAAHLTHNFAWFDLGRSTLRLGWLLDPLTALMCVMVTFVGLLIFIFSTGYMHEDANFKQFFCFLSLFAAAMLGLLVANSLLLLFICWELVGLASYLLIGFWFHKPAAAAAAKKAFITTRIGDLGLLLGLAWLAVPRVLRGDLPLGAWLLAGASVALAAWTLIHNKPGNFNIRPSPKACGTFITSGPYRLIRHPMYTSVLMGAAALAWASEPGLGGSAWLALGAVLLLKSALEERWMQEQHPGYGAYMRSSKRFLPWLF